MIRRPPRSTLFPYTTLFRSLDWIVLIVDRRGRAREIVDLVHFEQNRVSQIVPQDLEAGVGKKMGDVTLRAGEEIVQADHLRAGIQQPVTQVAAQKPCSP